MIPDTIIQKDTRNGELFTTLVYWIKTEHIYWKVLDTNYKDACVVAKMDTGPKSALLAIDRAHMDGVIIKMWDLLYSNNRTYRILNLDQ